MTLFKTVFSVFFFLFVIILAAFFVGFNLDFRAPVSLVFKSYESVPVLLTVAVSFIAGFLLATFIFLTGMTGRFFKERKKRKEEKIRLKTALPEKEKLSGLPHYDE